MNAISQLCSLRMSAIRHQQPHLSKIVFAALFSFSQRRNTQRGSRLHMDNQGGKPRVIEVERKFVYDEGTPRLVLEQGGRLERQVSFRDVYYDTADYALTLADHWLRRRDAQWQLKCRPSGDMSAAVLQSPTTRYLEYETESDICSCLQKLLEARGKLPKTLLSKSNPRQIEDRVVDDVGVVDELVDDGDDGAALNLSVLLTASECREFAAFRTDRQTYSLDGFTVDLDATDFGFRVGEIETLVADENLISDAVARIDELAHKLGVSSAKRVQGKMDAYLKQKNPDHYHQVAAAAAAAAVDAAAAAGDEDDDDEEAA